MKLIMQSTDMSSSYGAGYGYTGFYNNYGGYNQQSRGTFAGGYIDPNVTDVGFDTSSKDPLLQRSRVFIGNLQRVTVSRDEVIKLFSRFGKVTACSFFQEKGYAFVQFTSAGDADTACLKLNQSQVFGARVDVHLAMLGSSNKKPSGEGFEQTQNPIISNPPSNGKNKTAAVEDSTSAKDLTETGVADTMICGSCRFVTDDYDQWREHKIAGCQRKREANEPEHKLRCANCKKRFLSSWGLLEHLTDFHRMMLYMEVPKETTSSEETAADESLEGQEPPAKKSALDVEVDSEENTQEPEEQQVVEPESAE